MLFERENKIRTQYLTEDEMTLLQLLKKLWQIKNYNLNYVPTIFKSFFYIYS